MSHRIITAFAFGALFAGSLAGCAKDASHDGSSASSEMVESDLDARFTKLLGTATTKSVEADTTVFTANDDLHRVLRIKGTWPAPAIGIELTGDHGYANASAALAWPDWVKSNETANDALDTMATQVVLNGWGACRQVCGDAHGQDVDACFDAARPSCTAPDQFAEKCGTDADCIAAETDACFQAAGVAECAQKKLDACIAVCGDQPKFHD